jgi:hypothetical protein
LNLSASDNLVAPSVPISSVLSENEHKALRVLLLRTRDVRDVFNLSASDNWIIPSLSMLLSVLSEHEMKQQICYRRE